MLPEMCTARAGEFLTHRGRSGLPSQCPKDMTIIVSIVEYTPKLDERGPLVGTTRWREMHP